MPPSFWTFIDPPLGITSLPWIHSILAPVGRGAFLIMYLSLDPSLRTASTFIEEVPVVPLENEDNRGKVTSV